MRSDEEILERVLAGLGEAQVPEGMERRILGGLEMRADAGASSRRGWIEARRPLAWGLGLAGLIAGVWIATGSFRPGRDGTNPVRQPQAVADGSSEARVSAGDMPRLHSSPRREVSKGFERKELPPTESQADSIAVSDMRAVSFPAPPMPLTEQEELLLRIAHKGDPEELAMLEPEIRIAREKQEKLEVQRFFEAAASGTEAPLKGDDTK